MQGLRVLLLVFYVLSSLPVQANYHYCLGRVKQITFYEESVRNCVCPAEEAYSDCCETEHALLDFQDDHTAVPGIALEMPFSAMLLPIFAYVVPQALMPAEKGLTPRGPPVACKPESLYLANCNFRL